MESSFSEACSPSFSRVFAESPARPSFTGNVTSALIQELDRWEERLEELFAGRPYDVYDAALTATISDFPVSIQPFRDMVRSYQLVERRSSSILLTLGGVVKPMHVLCSPLSCLAPVSNYKAHAPRRAPPTSVAPLRSCKPGMHVSCQQSLSAPQIDGMRMDLVKPRYETFDELYEYCYKVAGTVGLMTTPVMGIEPSYTVRCNVSLVPRSCHSHKCVSVLEENLGSILPRRRRLCWNRNEPAAHTCDL